VSSSDVELRGVVKRFGAFTAVAGIDLEVESGRFTTLLGPSGCGKTTTLRMIGGLEWPDEGTIRVGGRPVSTKGDAGRLTRMVFQNYALFPHMTVAQNVAFGLRMQKLPRDEIAQRTAAIAELLGLSAQLAKHPHQMSGGQQQRVALARALVTRPRVLLLDEPLGALDLKMRKQLQAELKKLQREVGITFVYVTHDQEEALALSDTIVVMDRGRIVQRGTPAEVYARPQSAYVADFIGEANLIPGRVRETRGADVTVDAVFGAVGGARVDGRTPAPGAAAIVAVRPEHVTLGPGRDGGPLRHRGEVVEATFLGGVTRVSVRLGTVIVRADVSGAAAPAGGDAVSVGWEPRHAHVLEADERFMDNPDRAPAT
jgi:spermidine/putrescine transport system ATP-binding protein